MTTEKSSILDEAQKFAQDMLETELPEKIVYHSLAHTRHVVDAALEIADQSNVTDQQREIIELAAWFHDLGYTKSVNDHEKKSAKVAREFLIAYNYPEEQLSQVIDCILATKMPQDPKNKMEKILCDADLVHLANNNYCEIAELLQEELEKVHGKEIKDKDWYEKNIDFIQNHQFFTDYARREYTQKVKDNLHIIRNKVNQMNDES